MQTAGSASLSAVQTAASSVAWRCRGVVYFAEILMRRAPTQGRSSPPPPNDAHFLQLLLANVLPQPVQRFIESCEQDVQFRHSLLIWWRGPLNEKQHGGSLCWHYHEDFPSLRLSDDYRNLGQVYISHKVRFGIVCWQCALSYYEISAEKKKVTLLNQHEYRHQLRPTSTIVRSI